MRTRLTRILGGVVSAVTVVTRPLPRGDHTAARTPEVFEHRYVLDARMRPLLFWVSKEDVGRGRLTRRRADEGALGFELLIGSDPSRAPRRVNRWAYVLETPRAGATDVVVLVRDPGGVTPADAEAADERAATDGYGVDVFRATATADAHTARAGRPRLRQDATFREAEALEVDAVLDDDVAW